MAHRSYVVFDNRAWMTAKVHTAQEATQLLEGLRKAYRSLAPDERREVKDLMTELLDSQRRFGSPYTVVEAFLSRRGTGPECCSSTEE